MMTAKSIVSWLRDWFMDTPAMALKHGGYVAPMRGARGRWDDASRYTGARLREIRKRKGVGRPPQPVPMGISPMASYKGYPSLVGSYWLGESLNLAEWQRKQRRGESDEDYRKRRAA